MKPPKRGTVKIAQIKNKLIYCFIIDLGRESLLLNESFDMSTSFINPMFYSANNWTKDLLLSHPVLTTNHAFVIAKTQSFGFG